MKTKTVRIRTDVATCVQGKLSLMVTVAVVAFTAIFARYIFFDLRLGKAKLVTSESYTKFFSNDL